MECCLNKFFLVGLKALFILVAILMLFRCGEDDAEPVTPDPEPEGDTISIDVSVLKQEMVGFGGSMTWYSDRMTASDDKEEIADLLFTELGIDIIRFKNWYYPDGYPAVTNTTSCLMITQRNYGTPPMNYTKWQRIEILISGSWCLRGDRHRHSKIITVHEKVH